MNENLTGSRQEGGSGQMRSPAFLTHIIGGPSREGGPFLQVGPGIMLSERQGEGTHHFQNFGIVVQSLSCVQLFLTSWTIALQAPLSMGFSRQKSWSRLPFSPLWDLPDPGIEPAPPSLAGRFLTPEPPGTPIFRTAVPHMHPESP